MTDDLEAVTNRSTPYRVVLHQEPEGVYAFAYSDITILSLIRDDLYDNLEQAMKFCELDYGIPPTAWRPVGK
jgi:hypothetical protein